MAKKKPATKKITTSAAPAESTKTVESTVKPAPAESTKTVEGSVQATVEFTALYNFYFKNRGLSHNASILRARAELK